MRFGFGAFREPERFVPCLGLRLTGMLGRGMPTPMTSPVDAECGGEDAFDAAMGPRGILRSGRGD